MIKTLTRKWRKGGFRLPTEYKKVLNVWTEGYNNKWEINEDILTVYITTKAYYGTPTKGVPEEIKIRILI